MVCSEYSMTRHDTHPGSHTINRPMLLADFSFRLLLYLVYSLLYLVYSLPRACYQVPPAPFFFLASGRVHRFRLFFPPVLAFLQFLSPQRVQQSHCSSIFHRVLLTHALALSASQFCKKCYKDVNLCTRKSPNDFVREYLVCTRRGSNSRN